MILQTGSGFGQPQDWKQITLHCSSEVAGTRPESCSGSGRNHQQVCVKFRPNCSECFCCSVLTFCWMWTMSMRSWAPGERLVPISFTRNCTACMSIPGPRGGLGWSCLRPTTIRPTITLFLPPRERSWEEMWEAAEVTDRTLNLDLWR